jgi:type 1 glutamine amidotransferase
MKSPSCSRSTFLRGAFALCALAIPFQGSLVWAQPAPIKVLLIDGQNNHNWKATSPVILSALGKSGRFEVEVSTTPPKGAPKEAWADWNPKFSAYAAVVSNYNGELWPEQVQRAFEKYVSDGGGFVCLHAANNAFPEWLEYNRMIGIGGWGGRNEKNGPLLYRKEGQVVRDTVKGNGGGHGPQHEFVVEVLDQQHPITKGLPSKWKHTADELYHALRGPAENLSLLGVAYSPVTQREEPMLLTLSYGKGRVFHTPMGHADVSMRCAGFQTLLERGAEWAASGAVTLPVPPDFPGAENTSARP